MLRNEYDPKNQEHTDYIRQQIQSVNEEYAKLFWADMLLAPAGIATLGWLSGQLTFVGLCGFAALEGYTIYSKPENRRQQVERFQMSLKHLFEAYEWCGKSGVQMSNDENFLAALEAIAPFVPTKKLLLWNVSTAHPDDLSTQFIDILSQAPHQTQFVLGKERKRASTDEPNFISRWLSSAVPSLWKKSESKYASGNIQDARTNWETYVAQPLASSKLFWYGYKDPDTSRSTLGTALLEQVAKMK